MQCNAILRTALSRKVNIWNSRPNYIMDYVASVDLLKTHLEKFWRFQESGCCLIGKLTLPESDTYQHALSLVSKVTTKMLYWRYAVSASVTTPTILL